MARADVPTIEMTAPDRAIVDADGEPVTLATYYAETPVVLLFYRGWW